MKIAINAMYIVVKVNIFIKNIELFRKKAGKRKIFLCARLEEKGSRKSIRLHI